MYVEVKKELKQTPSDQPIQHTKTNIDFVVTFVQTPKNSLSEKWIYHNRMDGAVVAVTVATHSVQREIQSQILLRVSLSRIKHCKF